MSFIMLRVIMLNVITLSVIMLNVITLSVIMLSVKVPKSILCNEFVRKKHVWLYQLND